MGTLVRKGNTRRNHEVSTWSREVHSNFPPWLPRLPTFHVCTVYDLQAAQRSSFGFPFPAMSGKAALLVILAESSLGVLHSSTVRMALIFLKNCKQTVLQGLTQPKEKHQQQKQNPSKLQPCK